MEIKPFSPKRVQQAVDRKAVQQNGAELRVNLDAGHLLFAHGDSGGDLYFIESGVIEIYIRKKDQEIILAEMGPGEVIGVMTLLTAEPRLASARAKDAAVVKKISRSHVARLISTFPKWLNVVLKEFTIRINEMNRRYSETLIELKKSRETQITSTFIATQMARAMPVIGKTLVKNQDGKDTVPTDALLEMMEQVLNQPREMIAGVWQVFTDSGVIALDIDQEKKRKVVAFEKLEKATDFAKFIRDSAQGVNKRILKSKLTFQEINTANTLVKYVLDRGAAADKSGTFKLAEIESEFEQKTGLIWEFSHLEKLIKLGLISSKQDGQESTLMFTPLTLGRTLALVAAVKKFNGDDEGGSEISSIQDASEDADAKSKATSDQQSVEQQAS